MCWKVALVVRAGSVIAPGRQVTGPALAVLTCRAGEGWVLAARPFSLGSDAVMQLQSVRPTALPGGAHGATVTVLSYVASGESHATPYLMGVSTPDLPVRLPRAASVGVLAVIGTAGERVGAEGTPGYRSVVPFDATGWYPLGDEQVFVRVARERSAAEGGQPTDTVRATQLARLGAHGFTGGAGGNASAIWLIMGPGDPPAWCGSGGALHCGRLSVEGAALTDGTIPYGWVAGSWHVGAEVPRDLTAPGARWFYAGAWEGSGPPRDPNRGEPLTVVAVQSNAPAPTRGGHHSRQ